MDSLDTHLAQATSRRRSLAEAAIGSGALIAAPTAASPRTPAAPTAPLPPSVSARGFSLASTSVDPPADEGQYPDGPHADVINATGGTIPSR